MTTTKLPEYFQGTGEVKEFIFRRIKETDNSYIYEVTHPEALNPHYEVFRKKAVPICLDFVAKVYSETEFKEVYPKSNAFGVSAWCVTSIEEAEKYILKLDSNG